jgi:phosphoribosylformylglycinamidine synthase subunit PurS
MIVVYAACVAKIVVDVMLKPEIHDPQGEAIAGACHRLGFTEVVSVRQGKRFEVEVAEPGEGDSIAGGPAVRVAELAAELLANPVIEEFAIHDV